MVRVDHKSAKWGDISTFTSVYEPILSQIRAGKKIARFPGVQFSLFLCLVFITAMGSIRVSFENLSSFRFSLATLVSTLVVTKTLFSM